MVIPRHIELQDRDIDVLKHIARYRMTVEGVLENMPFFKSATRDAVKGVIRRLREAGYVESAPLYQRKCYYYLTKRGANAIGDHEYVAGPFATIRKSGATLHFLTAVSTAIPGNPWKMKGLAEGSS